MSGAAPAVSIVVPMYNVEAFLPRCIESLRGQSLTDVEIVLVNDGSPDRCGELAEGYAKEDARIKVVHRRNGGLGPARNSGIDTASGEYVGFVDSDDWVEPETFERLYEAAKRTQADAVYGGYRIVSHGQVVETHAQPKGNRVLVGANEVFDHRRSFYGAAPNRLPEDPVPVSACVGLFRRDFLNKHRLRFFNVRSEDKFFNTAVCRKAEVVACVDDVGYRYRKDDQPSITKTFDSATTDSFFELFRRLEDMADEEPDSFRGECTLRARRCIMDYSRTLAKMIEASSLDGALKRKELQRVLASPSLQRACSGYPFWRLSLPQMVFYVCERLRLVRLSQLLVRMKG